MKTLRAKLFVSVGVVLLIVAFLNYFTSEIWIRRELQKASRTIDEHVATVEEKLREFFSFIVSYQVVLNAIELDGLSKIIAGQVTPSTASNFWTLATKVASYNPQIAFVQFGDASVSLETSELYSPCWAPMEGEMLWISLPGKNRLFAALPVGNYYWLFEARDLETLLPATDALTENLEKARDRFQKIVPQSFIAFENPSSDLSWRDSVKALFDALLNYETRWVEKMNLVQQLAVLQSEKTPLPVAGLLKIDPTFVNGYCVLTDEVFIRSPIIRDFSSHSDTPVPFLLMREEAGKSVLDMARVLDVVDGSERMAVGFSVSSLVSKIARLINRPIILTWNGPSIGFMETGVTFSPDLSSVDLSKKLPITVQGNDYIPHQIDLQELQLTILTPESMAFGMTWFLDNLRTEISWKISLSLVAAAFLSFLIALFMLNNISRKFTKPIVLLSHAAEELGAGKYDGLILPKLGTRHDEVAILTHSFEKMVGALRDRDKIRGVLNKVVSKEITEEILKGGVELGGEERTLTLLFSDIRGFTHFSEHLDPKTLIGLLNDYMTRMCRIIDATHGVVDKFVGDEIMALYGAPITLIDHPIQAIEAAVRMIQALRLWNEERKRKGEPTFEIGIGIHTGVACTGNVGAENRLNYTAIGANVNLASRLCTAAAPMQILVSEAVYTSPGVQSRFRFQALPPATLKGIDHPVPVWAVLE